MKKLAKEILENSNGECFNCGGLGTELHHAIGGRGKRKQHQTKESVYLLCGLCHRGTAGCHGRDGNELNLKLKRTTQERYFKQGLDEDEVRKRMGGRLYE